MLTSSSLAQHFIASSGAELSWPTVLFKVFDKPWLGPAFVCSYTRLNWLKSPRIYTLWWIYDQSNGCLEKGTMNDIFNVLYIKVKCIGSWKQKAKRPKCNSYCIYTVYIWESKLYLLFIEKSTKTICSSYCMQEVHIGSVNRQDERYIQCTVCKKVYI
jgi:hypothetical protein